MQYFLVDQRSARRMELNFAVQSVSSYSTEATLNVVEPVEQMELDLGDTTESVVSEENDPSSTALASTSSTMTLRSGQIEHSEEKASKYNTVKLNHIAIEAERHKVPDRVAAAIATATLIDFGIITSDDKTFVIDRSKIRRARQKQRKLRAESLEIHDMVALYFDGRSDETLKYENGKRTTIKEEHISILQQPKGLFIGHKAVTSKAAATIRDALADFADEKEIEQKINAIGSDGEPTNTGPEGGVIRLLELEWNKSLQWNICMLHMNELPLRALIKSLDGTTTGPRSFSGPIGNRLKNSEQLPIVQFEKINFVCTANLDEISHTLNTDQNYLYNICCAISNGTVSEQLANRTIGPMTHSRWTTTANRVLRLYVADPKPSQNLKIIATYIMAVYAPAMFEIKYRSSVVYAPIHIVKMIKSSRFLDGPALKVVDETISRNAFFAHAEHIVVSMLNDESALVRQKGWQMILNSREKETPDDEIRKFKVPPLNFNCNDYTDLIEMNDRSHTNPPILRNVEFIHDDIDTFAAQPILSHNFGKFLIDVPLHTQSVERAVKAMTEASKNVCGEEGRNGVVFNTLYVRNQNPVFNTKSDYNVELGEMSQYKI